MAMKSYTDLEQSKRLAEILPIETADMCYKKERFAVKYLPESICYKYAREQLYADCIKLIPCWSLAALINYLPLEVSINKQTNSVDTYYYIVSYDCRYRDIHIHRHNNLVDACVEMINKLKDVNLL